jgi:hypothetical protein
MPQPTRSKRLRYVRCTNATARSHHKHHVTLQEIKGLMSQDMCPDRFRNLPRLSHDAIRPEASRNALGGSS